MHIIKRSYVPVVKRRGGVESLVVVGPGVSDVGPEGGGVGAGGGRVRGARVHAVEVAVGRGGHHGRGSRAAVRRQVVHGPDAHRGRGRRRRGRSRGERGQLRRLARR